MRVDDAGSSSALRRVTYPLVVIGTVPSDVAVDNVRANSAGGRPDGAGAPARAGLPADRVRQRSRATPCPARRGAAPSSGPPRRSVSTTTTSLRVEAGDFTLAEGRKAAETLLDRTVPDAVLGGNDLLAIATMQVLAERGLRIPDDVAVVGMDDTELAGVTTPTLTSVDLGALERGRAAAQLLLDRLDDPERDREPRRIAVQPQTDSCAAPR